MSGLTPDDALFCMGEGRAWSTKIDDVPVLVTDGDHETNIQHLARQLLECRAALRSVIRKTQYEYDKAADMADFVKAHPDECWAEVESARACLPEDQDA